VYLSRFGSVAGVPVAITGLVWFGLTALISGFARPAVPSAAIGYLRVLSLIGLAVVLYLAYASFAVLGTGCLLCIGTYVCVAGILAASFMGRSVPFGELAGRLGDDLAAVVKNPAAAVCAALYVAGAAGAVVLFPSEAEAASRQAAAPAPTGDARADFAAAWERQPRAELGIDAEGAKVVVVKFNDFECPSCRQAEAYYNPIFQKFAISHPGAIKYVVKDYPLDSKCNFLMMQTIRGHEAACDASAAARMAKDLGKYAEMTDWIYANQGVSPAELRAAAQRILGVADFESEYARRLPDIRKDIAEAGAVGINSTPTYYINGVKLPGGMPAEYFELAITLEIEKGT
jgi:protein-disulfide isomerase